MSSLAATHTPTPQSFKASPVFLFVLVGLLAVQPITTDLYLPSLPSLAKAFSAPTSLITWTLSAQVGTFGLTQLFMGPLADRFGRRPIAMAGLLIYLLASIAALFAPVIEVLIACRSLQGLGVACAFITSRAMVRDLHEPAEGARTLARGLMMMSIVPITGPFIGGLLDTALGWQGPFMALMVFSASVLLLVWRVMPETNTQRNPQATDVAPLLRNYRSIARHPVFLAYNTVSALSFGGIFAFLSGSSFVFISIFGLSRTLYGLAFGITGLAYLLGTLLARRLVAQRGIQRTVRFATLLSVSAGSTLLALALVPVHHPLAVLLPCAAFIFAHAMIQPCTQSACTAPFPQMAGAASALNGFSQMAVAVLIGIVIGKSFNGTTLPLALTLFTMSVAVALTGWLVVKRYGDMSKL
jgi:MFS transporter, DHA1 family, multidrug resistance protein